MTPEELLKAMVDETEGIAGKQASLNLIENAHFRGMSELNEAIKTVDLSEKRLLMEAAAESFDLAYRHFKHLDYSKVEKALLSAVREIRALIEKTKMEPAPCGADRS